VIQFTLRCDKDHRFESWFQTADAFDKLAAAGMVTCAVCGSSSVEKALMAPRVRPGRDSRPEPESGRAPAPDGAGPLSAPASAAEQALAELKRKIEQTSDYVGTKFAREARDMHAGLVPARPIHGEARIEEAKKLVEDGVPVAPLPFRIGRKSN